MTNRLRDDVNSTATTASKERQPGSVQIPDLDATQELVIAVLKTTREHWHSSVDPYSPLKAHVSVPTRYAAGKALRNKVPRESHAEWNPPKNRPPAVDLVMAGNAGRQPELVPLRIGRMAASPSAFLRGAAAVMAWDLSHSPITGMMATLTSTTSASISGGLSVAPCWRTRIAGTEMRPRCPVTAASRKSWTKRSRTSPKLMVTRRKPIMPRWCKPSSRGA